MCSPGAYVTCIKNEVTRPAYQKAALHCLNAVGFEFAHLDLKTVFQFEYSLTTLSELILNAQRRKREYAPVKSQLKSL